MESFSRRIFERLAGFAETDSDREVYLNALGSGNQVEKEKDRYERLLRQLIAILRAMRYNREQIDK